MGSHRRKVVAQRPEADYIAKTLIVDGNNLAWTAYHSMPTMRTGRRRTEVVFGFLRKLLSTQLKVKARKIVFCWDTPRYKRVKLSPAYKGERDSEDRKIAKAEVIPQVDLLKSEVLPFLGFKNIFWRKGYEADDLIAALVRPRGFEEREKIIDNAVIMSSDDDLLQLLDDDTCIYNIRRKKIFRKKDFIRKYNCDPYWWAEVKCMTGCKGDAVQGIDGIGEKYAIGYMNGSLSQESKARQKIVDGVDITVSNRRLIYLPYGTYDLKTRKKYWKKYLKFLKVEREILFLKDFRRVFSEYGFRSFLNEDMERWQRAFRLR